MHLTQCSAALRDRVLSLPPVSACHLHIEFDHQPFPSPHSRHSLPPRSTPLPLCAAEPALFHVHSARATCTRGAVASHVLDVWLDPVDRDTCARWSLCPGDSVAVLCANRPVDVDWLMCRLRVSAVAADGGYQLHASAATTARLPSHVPGEGQLRHVLTHCVCLRHVPRRSLLRVLAAHTSCALERRRLEELCSSEGSGEYEREVRVAGITLLQVLRSFASCRPPLAALLQHLPPLKPRVYSLASSPARHDGRLRLLVSVIQRPHAGLFSSWLHEAITDHPPSQQCCQVPSDSDARYDSEEADLPCVQQSSNNDRADDVHDLASQMCDVTLRGVTSPVSLWLYPRATHKFRLPSSVESTEPPVAAAGPRRLMVLLAAGTGLAPFLSWLDECDGVDRHAWLVYGCRHWNCDLLAAGQLARARQHGPLCRLDVTFSRPEAPTLDVEASSPSLPRRARYVQHVLACERERLVRWLRAGATVFVCGGAAMVAAVRRQMVVALCQLTQQQEVASCEPHLSSSTPKMTEPHQLRLSSGLLLPVDSLDCRPDEDSESLDEHTFPTSVVADAERTLKDMQANGLYNVDVW